jgi:hypothetical protein
VESLAKSNLLLFATATDAGLNNLQEIQRHQQLQVLKIRENVPRMHFEAGRHAVSTLASQLAGISPQLYAQLVCQVDLIYDVVWRSVNFFAQRIPATLGEFRWHIDQKNNTKTIYEEAFEKIAPGLLQSRSFRQPFWQIEGFDYRHFTKYLYIKGEEPSYLKTEYGIHIEGGINIGKLLRKDLRFRDSKSSVGIQVSDLLASGLRRCLRGGFYDNDVIARALGALTLQNESDKHPIHLVSFGETEVTADRRATMTIKTMRNVCRPMLL